MAAPVQALLRMAYEYDTEANRVVVVANSGWSLIEGSALLGRSAR